MTAEFSNNPVNGLPDIKVTANTPGEKAALKYVQRLGSKKRLIISITDDAMIVRIDQFLNKQNLTRRGFIEFAGDDQDLPPAVKTASDALAGGDYARWLLQSDSGKKFYLVGRGTSKLFIMEESATDASYSGCVQTLNELNLKIN